MGDCVKVRGGSHVPSSLVWVSVPPSGSASSSAPGSLKGLSLREETQEGGEERHQNDVHSSQEQRDGWGGGESIDGVNAANQSEVM